MKQLKKKQKNIKADFFGLLFGTLGTSLLENLLTDQSIIRADEGTIRAGQDF